MTTSHQSRSGHLFAGVAVLCLIATASQAQTGEDQAAGQTGRAPSTNQVTVSEVVVTAQYREENVQDVSIAISAVAGEQLQAQGVTGFKELGLRVPSLRFGAGVTGGENVITMRGLGSQNTTPGGDSPVAYNLDGVYLQRTTAIDPEFYDIARVEVLRGPQGTLYGRNSVGGSINVITNKPTDEFEAGADAMIGNYEARTLRGYVSGPLVDSDGFRLMGRLTAVSAQHEGYSENLSSKAGASDDQDSQDYQMLRAQLAFEFSPEVRLLLAANLAQNEGLAANNVAWWQTPARYINPPLGIPIGSACDFSTEAKFDPRRFCHDAAEYAENETSLYAATFDWELPFGVFTSVTAYGTSEVDQVNDGDGSDLPMALSSRWYLDTEQFSQEFRLASNNPASPLQWVVGGIYFYGDNFQDYGYSDFGYNDSGPTAPFDQFNFFSQGRSETESYAAFTQLDYSLAETSAGVPLTFTLGLRYTEDTKSGFNQLDYQLPLVCGGSCGVTAGPFSRTWEEVTGKLGAKYDFSDDTMIYASVSRGYLAGGNIIGLGTIYDPETLMSYDAGVKTQLFDRRVQVNLAAYHQEIEGLQVFIQSATQSGINNVDGTTDVNGLEAELSAAPTDALRLNATVTLTDAEYGRYISTDGRFGGPGPGCDAVTRLCNFEGNKLNQTPPYSVNLGAEYRIDTAYGRFTPRIDAFFSGEVNFLPDNLSPQDEYSLINARVTWTSPNDRYRVEAFVNNLEDDDVISNDGLQSISLGQQVLQPDNYAYYPPRLYGVRVGVSY